uniref:Uncharacterized protein n=1 Tax=Siphoviridae sp. ctF7F8 TaxID=2826211 RepID=A0A8S5MK23_9CAUD|nr:MAG TPA: hypothetical protein [Siphoviridae sp. ctF7F8]
MKRLVADPPDRFGGLAVVEGVDTFEKILHCIRQ